MKFFLKPTDPAKLDVDALIYFCWENEFGKLKSLPAIFLADLNEAAKREDFTAEEGKSLVLSGKGIISAYKFILIGLGKKEKFDISNLYKSVATALRRAKEAKPAKIALVPHDDWIKNYDAETVYRIIFESMNLSDYQFLKYKSEDEKKKVREIEEVILSVPASKLTVAEQAVNLAEVASDAVIFARNLVNEPPEFTSPSFLAQTAEDLARESKGEVKVKIFERQEIEKLGMNSFLGVAAGSEKAPKFIRLSYKPAGVSSKIVLIGKGITFDTGGLSLKSAEHMETMKLDMAGAAAVLAIFKALPKIHPKVETVGLIAACENMPGGKALKPGDILRVMDGTTIEVLNTDAEGRLTLADAISYAKLKEKPDGIIDLATLTGACMVALGQEIAGIWGNNEKLVKKIESAAQTAGEKVWKMPLETDYKPLIKSHIADVKNTQDGKYGGAITAALFLHKFVGDIPWAHLDIAGPAFAEKDTPFSAVGGTGFGVRLLLSFLSKSETF